MASLSCSGSFLELYLMACLAYRRLNLSESILAASITRYYSSFSYSVLMSRGVSFSIGVSFWSGDTQVILSGV